MNLLEADTGSRLGWMGEGGITGAWWPGAAVVQSLLLFATGGSVSRLQRQEVASLQATMVCLLHLALGGWVLHAG